MLSAKKRHASAIPTTQRVNSGLKVSAKTKANVCRLNSIQILEDAGRAHAAADAHRHHAVIAAAPFHVVDDLHSELGAGAAER